MKNLNIEVTGINCGSCVSKIINHFSALEGIEKVNAEKETQLVTIACDESLSNMKLRNDLIELGFSVTSIKKQ
ncbi:MAG: heavy-metal-associated domain-containing protein [Oligoflexia bacterium]|nr:heavy-metal-associated domain-containing protein [Oligoflexia bacterium]